MVIRTRKLGFFVFGNSCPSLLLTFSLRIPSVDATIKSDDEVDLPDEDEDDEEDDDAEVEEDDDDDEDDE